MSNPLNAAEPVDNAERNQERRKIGSLHSKYVPLMCHGAPRPFVLQSVGWHTRMNLCISKSNERKVASVSMNSVLIAEHR